MDGEGNFYEDTEWAKWNDPSTLRNKLQTPENWGNSCGKRGGLMMTDSHSHMTSRKYLSLAYIANNTEINVIIITMYIIFIWRNMHKTNIKYFLNFT